VTQAKLAKCASGMLSFLLESCMLTRSIDSLYAASMLHQFDFEVQPRLFEDKRCLTLNGKNIFTQRRQARKERPNYLFLNPRLKDFLLRTLRLCERSLLVPACPG
jgi:hypothetical protein